MVKATEPLFNMLGHSDPMDLADTVDGEFDRIDALLDLLTSLARGVDLLEAYEKARNVHAITSFVAPVAAGSGIVSAFSPEPSYLFVSFLFAVGAAAGASALRSYREREEHREKLREHLPNYLDRFDRAERAGVPIPKVASDLIDPYQVLSWY